MAQTKTEKPSTVKRPPRTLAGNTPPAAPNGLADGRTHALEQYEQALELLQSGKYHEAHTAFQAMLDSSPADLAASIRMYIAACLQQLSKRQNNFANNEERYDYGIYLLNDGLYEDAREHFEAIIDTDGSADYAFYGLAVLASMTGDAQTCLDRLAQAIERNPRNRIQARSDSDFQDMADDPRFTELLYPEV